MSDIPPLRAEPRARTASGWSIPLALVAVLGALWLAGGGLWDHVGGRDTHAVFVSQYEAAGRALRELRLPLWNPYEFLGTPLLGAGQGAMLYPPVAIPFALLPPRAALQTLYLLHVALFVLATARYARRHTIAGPAAALAPLIGFAVLLSGIGYNGIDHPNAICELAWIPVLLLGVDHVAEGAAARGVALLATAWGAQWLAGHPDFAFDGAALVGLAVLLHPSSTLPRRALPVALGLGLGAFVAAPQILALLETLQQSIRPEHAHNFAPFRERALRVDSFADLARTPLRAAFLPAIALAMASLLRLDRVRMFWLVALAWCTIPLNLPFSLLYELPPFSGSRLPVAWSLIGGLFLGLLAAAGFTDLTGGRGRWWRTVGLTLAAATLLHSLFVVARAPTLLRGRAPDYGLLASRAAVLRDVMGADPAAPRFLGALEVDGAAPLRHALRSPTGYEPAVPPRRPVGLLKDLGLHESTGWGTWPRVARAPDLAALVGIGYVAANPTGAAALTANGFTPVRELPGGDVLLHRPPLPRVRLLHAAVVADDDLASLRHVLRAPERARDQVVLEGASGAALAATFEPPPSEAAEVARIRLDDPEHVVIEVEAASPGVLVLQDAWSPSWTATVDGRPATIHPADHAFRAVAIPPGRHEVEMRYAPRWLVPSLLASGSAGFTILILFAASVRRLRPRPRAESAADASRMDAGRAGASPVAPARGTS